MKKSFVLIMILTLVILLVSCDLNFPGSLMDGIPTEPSAPTESEERTNPIEHPQHTESSEPADPTESTKTTEPAVHEHSFGDWVITKHPTTTETGLKERSCSCGERETETIPVVESGLEFEFSSEHNGYFVTGKGTNKDVDLVIPSEYNGYPVVGIAHEAFYMNVYAKSITIPDSVKYIENEAFIYAEMLESVYMSDSVVLIEYGAFSECLSLKTVRLSNSLEALPERLFKNSKKLEEVNIPDSVKTIGGEAFYECVALKSISFPRGLTEIGGYAFYKCKSLASDLLIPDGVEEIQQHTFHQCESVKNVRLPASLKSIGEYAFDGCSSLEQVVMEEGTALEKLDEYAFSDCVKLQIFNFENASTAEAQFVIPDTLTSIGDGAFMDCPITCAITIPAKVKDIGRGAFYGTKIPEIYFVIKDGWKRWQVINQGVPPSFYPVSVSEVSDPAIMAEKMTKTDTRAMRLFEN